MADVLSAKGSTAVLTHAHQANLIRSVEVDPEGGPTILTLVCGHRVERANHFSYKVGDVEHCVQCKGRGISGGSRWVKR